MKYLCIENSGEIEVNAVRLKGASTKREDHVKIGKFGTGEKYALAVLMKEKIKIVIMSGEDKLTFHTEKAYLKDQEFDEVILQKHKTKIPLSITTEMGLDWGIPQALREIVANAYDEGMAGVYIAKAIDGRAGYTRTFIELADPVAAFFNNLKHWFCKDRTPIEDGIIKSPWGSNEKGGERYSTTNVNEVSWKIFSAPAGDGTRVYKNGVLVYVNKEQPACFDYEISSLNVKEDRTCSQYDVHYALPKVLNALSKPNKIKLLNYIEKNPDALESTIDSYSLDYDIDSPDWKEILQEKVVTTEEVKRVVTHELSKVDHTILPQKWTKVLTGEHNKCRKAEDIMSVASLKGFITKEITPEQWILVEKATAFLADLGIKLDPHKISLFETDKEVDSEYDAKEDNYFLNYVLFSKGTRALVETLLKEFFKKEIKHPVRSLEYEAGLVKEMVNIGQRILGEFL